MDLLLAILGGAAGAALISGSFGVIMWSLNRKAVKDDRAESRAAVICATRGEQIDKLNQRMNGLVEADRIILYDRIKHLAKAYIARGYVTVEELEDLKMMHKVYHDPDKLDGNRFLDDSMNTICDLPKRAN